MQKMQCRASSLIRLTTKHWCNDRVSSHLHNFSIKLRHAEMNVASFELRNDGRKRLTISSFRRLTITVSMIHVVHNGGDDNISSN